MKKKMNKHKRSAGKALFHVIKRSFDIIVGLLGCILLIPVSLIIKVISICNKDFNSIFYSHVRIGKNGKEFRLYKFRSMVPNADEVLKEILKDPILGPEYKKNKKLANDPRITKVGKFIRNFSIDELPQFINILLGHMSLVGNRPYLPREKEDMGKFYNDIIKTKPGLTGYWQVSGRSDVSFKKRLELEQFYSNNYSIKLDLEIIFRTVTVVLLKKGAK